MYYSINACQKYSIHPPPLGGGLLEKRDKFSIGSPLHLFKPIKNQILIMLCDIFLYEIFEMSEDRTCVWVEEKEQISFGEY